jgi:hypothetical protein
MLLCSLVASLLSQLFGGRFTPTDMTSPPTAGSATGRWAARPVTDTAVKPDDVRDPSRSS